MDAATESQDEWVKDRAAELYLDYFAEWSADGVIKDFLSVDEFARYADDEETIHDWSLDQLGVLLPLGSKLTPESIIAHCAKIKATEEWEDQ